MKPFVLIVDDEFGLADLVATLLVERGYEAGVVINGKLALATMLSRTVDIVLTDMMMPIMDGPALIREMRADPRLREIPVILMTALPEAVPHDDDVRHDAVLVKPFAFDELLATIERLLPPR